MIYAPARIRNSFFNRLFSMLYRFRLTLPALFMGFILLFFGPARRAAAETTINLNTFGVAVPQNFDMLALSGTSSTLPTGWALSESGTNANTEYTANTGNLTTGDTYSYGATSNSERAFGTLQSSSNLATIGAGFTNRTTGTITALSISYTGEQWRLGATGRADRLDFQYSLNATGLTDGTWTDVDALDFTSPVTSGTVGALNGNIAPNRTAISFTINDLAIPDGAMLWLRWTDFNATGSDDGLAIDDFSITPNGVSGNVPMLSISDATVTEGNSSTATATFTVSLSAPSAAPVTFAIATADGTATVADNDYQPRNLTAQTIPAGAITYQFAVTVNGDTRPEPDETFSVRVSQLSGAILFDGVGVGTITNDDAYTIHDLQGTGSASPFAGQIVTTRGLVTARKTTGFFLQAPDSEADNDPRTSEAIYVYTDTPLPATAVVGNLVTVTGRLTEYQPTADQVTGATYPTLTEITNGPTVTLIASGQTLPAPVLLTPADFAVTDANGLPATEPLEKYEAMRVRVASLTVVAPTEGSVNEASATSSSDGVFYGVLTGTPRPFREPGVELFQPAPPPNAPDTPRFDTNPERLRVDSNGQPTAARLEVTTGATITNSIGVLDLADRTATLLPDPTTPPGVTGNRIAQPVPTPATDEFTVVSFNLERFFDDVDDPNLSEPVLTAQAWQNRLAKASLVLRNYLHTPDIVGVEEVENLSALSALAAKLNADALAAGQVNPNYQAFLQEGLDAGGIDVGLLLKASRVNVLSVTQEGRDATYINPLNNQAETLNDRPPLVLRATINAPCGGTFPLTVIVNHLRSFTSVENSAESVRVRVKRRAQAQFLAQFIQARQLANPSERIVSIGDYNAYPFNDGYADSLGIIKGTPAPATQTYFSAASEVRPALINLIEETAPTERYSYVFGGNAQAIDHALATQNLRKFFTRFAYGHFNADFPESYRGDSTRPERLSDHDPLVAYFKFAGLKAYHVAAYNGGANYTAEVDTPAGCTWTAAANDSWLNILGNTSGNGAGVITWRAQGNPTLTTRRGAMTIAGRTLTVSQIGAEDFCTYSITPSLLKNVSANGGTGSLSVRSSCAWTAVSQDNWLTITSGASGTGNGTVTFSIEPNTNASRSGTLIVAGQAFTVKQKPR